MNKESLKIIVIRENADFIVKCPDLDIIETGSTLEGALQNFINFMIEDRENYLSEDKELCTEKAQSVYLKYLNMLYFIRQLRNCGEEI